MSKDEYPEHEKLHKVTDASQAIGEFLDFGLPRLGGGMSIYEKVFRECECSWCERGAGHRSPWHTEEEKATLYGEDDRRIHDRVQIAEWVPTSRTIQSMLAEWFEIDEDKLNAEKEQMLEAMRAA